MDTPQPQPTNTEANIRKAAEAIAEVLQMKQEFIRCHEFLANSTHRLVELLCHAESRRYLLEDSLTLLDTTYWLQHIDWQTKFLTLVLNFNKDPSSKTLRPLIELYGRDRDRVKVEVEILERQLKHRLATFAQPDDGGRGVDLAALHAVPGAGGVGVVQVVPALAEGEQGQRPQAIRREGQRQGETRQQGDQGVLHGGSEGGPDGRWRRINRLR